MSNSTALIAALVALMVMLLVVRRWQKGKRESLAVTFARLLRRLARWLWALGEAIEVGGTNLEIASLEAAQREHGNAFVYKDSQHDSLGVRWEITRRTGSTGRPLSKSGYVQRSG